MKPGPGSFQYKYNSRYWRLPVEPQALVVPEPHGMLQIRTLRNFRSYQYRSCTLKSNTAVQYGVYRGFTHPHPPFPFYPGLAAWLGSGLGLFGGGNVIAVAMPIATAFAFKPCIRHRKKRVLCRGR